MIVVTSLTVSRDGSEIHRSDVEPWKIEPSECRVEIVPAQERYINIGTSAQTGPSGCKVLLQREPPGLILHVKRTAPRWLQNHSTGSHYVKVSGIEQDGLYYVADRSVFYVARCDIVLKAVDVRRFRQAQGSEE